MAAESLLWLATLIAIVSSTHAFTKPISPQSAREQSIVPLSFRAVVVIALDTRDQQDPKYFSSSKVGLLSVVPRFVQQ
jgi:hypothetical protein